MREYMAAAPVGDGPVVRIGVDAIEPLQPDFGSVRPEMAATELVPELGVGRHGIGIAGSLEGADRVLEEILGRVDLALRDQAAGALDELA